MSEKDIITPIYITSVSGTETIYICKKCENESIRPFDICSRCNEGLDVWENRNKVIYTTISASGNKLSKYECINCHQLQDERFSHCPNCGMTKDQWFSLGEYAVDNINHPAHYTMGEFEVIDVIEDWKLCFHLGCAVKYIARAKHKDNEIQDLKKAVWYINRKIEDLKKDAT